MPLFSFEKISPPASRGPVAPAEVRKRGLIVQLLDRLVEARVKRDQKGVIFRSKRKRKT